MIPLAVTVSARHGQRRSSVAKAKAAEWGLPWLDRPEKGGLEALLAEQAEALLVLGAEGWVLRDRQGEAGYSPGMSVVRIKRLDSGHQADDLLVRLGELSLGDVVLDATLGLASDALVCARVVGPTGRVIGVEASLPLFVLVREGLTRMGARANSCAVEPRLGRAEEVLAAMPDASVDCVFFDPMFDRPRRGSGSFEVLRRFAVRDPLTPETLRDARRVARRWVVVKVGRYGKLLQRLGLTPVPQTRMGPLQWARVGPLAPVASGPRGALGPSVP